VLLSLCVFLRFVFTIVISFLLHAMLPLLANKDVYIVRHWFPQLAYQRLEDVERILWTYFESANRPLLSNKKETMASCDRNV